MSTLTTSKPKGDDLVAEKRPYEPVGACAEIFKSKGPECLLSGPAGCVAGETRIYNPIDGSETPISELCKNRIAPVVQTIFGPRQAHVPFRKGVADLYRIETGDGSSCLVTGNHLLMSRQGWRFASAFEVGEQILISSSSPLRSNLELGQKLYCEDARHLMRTASNCPDRCFEDRRLRDELLLLEEDISRFFSPLQGGALGRIRPLLQTGAAENGSARIRPCRSFFHRSTLGSDRLGATGRAEQRLSRERQGTFLRERALCQPQTQFSSETLRQPPFAEGVLGVDSKLHPCCAEASCHSFLARCELGLRLLKEPHRSFSHPFLDGKERELELSVLLLRAYILSCEFSLKSSYTGWGRITRLSYERTDEFFDIHVPGAEHYLAEGIYHHNTGKSLACLNKIYMCAEKYPGARFLICRKTRESITQSALVSWEEKVVPAGHPCLRGPARSERREYTFPNGSKIIVDGLRQSSRDNTQRVMSTEYDMIYVQEAIELSEAEWEQLTSRLRNNKMPYQQIIADTNPSAPTHWLKKRCDNKKCTMLHSKHTDNPALYDRKENDWTKFGAVYLEKLKNLTGARRARLYEGKWVSAEGAVYENWNESLNVIKRFEISKFWRRILSVDFGYVNAFVCQWHALDPDGRQYLYREYVRTKTRVEDHAKFIKSICDQEPYAEAVVCDHDAEDRATLEKHLERNTTLARKEISVGIQVLEGRMAVAGDGKPRFFVFDDALMDIDPEMEDEKKPIGFVAEVNEYVWDKTDPTKPKERPIPINDHSCDPCRYASMYFEMDNWVGPQKMQEDRDQQKENPIDWRSGEANWRGGSGVGTNWRLMEDV